MKKTIQIMLSVVLLMTFVSVHNIYGQEKKEMWKGVTAKILLDNEKVNVTEYTFAPGAVADWHSHPQHSVYAVTDAKMKIEVKDKEPATPDIKAGQAMWSPAVTHKVTNIGKAACTVVITELK